MSGIVHIVAFRDLERTRAMSRLGRSDRTVVVVTPSGRQTTLLSFSRDILMALRKNFDLSDSTRKGSDSHRSRDAHAWLASYGVTDIIVNEAGRLGVGFRDVASFADSLAARLWLIEYEPCKGKLAELLQGHRHDVKDIEEFESRWLRDERSQRQRSDPAGCTAPTGSFPVVPSMEGLGFRLLVRELLNPVDFAIVDRVFCAACDDTYAKIDDRDRQQHPQRLAWTFHRYFLGTDDPDEVVTAAHGMKVAGAHHYWQVNIDDALIRMSSRLEPRPGIAPASDWQPLHAFPRQEAPAVCAVHASDVPPDSFAGITVGGTADDGCYVTAADWAGEHRRIDIVEPGQVFVRAQLIRRRLGGASDDDPLFFEDTTAQSASRRSCRVAERVAFETGFEAVAVGAHTKNASKNIVRWAADRGVSFKSVSRGAADFRRYLAKTKVGL